MPLATVYRWRTRGGGPRGVKVGRHVRYRDADVEAWLEKHADASCPGKWSAGMEGQEGLGVPERRTPAEAGARLHLRNRALAQGPR